MMNDKNIDELFRDKLKDLEKTPPAYLFENITAGVSGARNRRNMKYWRIASIAAALLLAFVAGWQISEINSAGEKQMAVVIQPAPESSRDSGTSARQTEALTTTKETGENVINKSPDTSNSLNDQLLAAKTKASGNKKSVEQVVMAKREDSGLLLALNPIGIKVKNSSVDARVLDEKKAGARVTVRSIHTIDQQIMEQNSQNVQARQDNRRKNRWMVGAQLSPAVSVTKASHSAQYASNMLNSSSTSPVDLGGGLSVEYKPAKRWSVQSGVYYAGLAQTSGNQPNRSNMDYVSADPGLNYSDTHVNIEANKLSMNGTAGVIEFNDIPPGMVVRTNLEDKSLTSATVVSDARFIQNFQYLEIPLYLRYTLIDARFDVELMGGLSSNVLVGNNTYMDGSTGKTLVGKTQDMQDMSYSSTLGLGLKYGLSKRIFLNVEPRVKYYLNSLNNNAEVNYKPYTIGVFTGLSYRF